MRLNNSVDRIKVTDLVNRIKYHLETSFKDILVEGEITNFSRPPSGHYYFTLSDEGASIGCAMFRGDAVRNPSIKSLADGDKVELTGGIGVYVKRGIFQIVARGIRKMGKGDLRQEFEKLKMRLAKEGLFDTSQKKPLPKIPKKIAVITSMKGAALQDFINVFKRRALGLDILIVPSLVQGEEAPRDLRVALHRSIEYSLKKEKIDVIVLTRGGGSLEDLWAFNDEGLALDIHNCPVPVVSAVGHQVDYTICDFVSDLRCETPTAAAEYLSQYQTTLKMKVNHLNSFFKHYSDGFLGKVKERLNRGTLSFQLQLLKDLLHTQRERTERCHVTQRIQEFFPFREMSYRADEAHRRSDMGIHHLLKNKKNEIQARGDILESLGPQRVLARGFSFVKDTKGRVVSNLSSFKKVPPGESLAITFRDGQGRVCKV